MKKLLYNINLYPDESNHYSDCALLVNDGKVEEIVLDYQTLIEKYEAIDCGGLIGLPGFIDVHTHGGFGVDFLKDSQRAVKEFSKQVVKEGCTAYLASFVSEEHDYLVNALKDYAEGIDDGFAKCAGVHLEGPFLNTKYQAVMRKGTLRNPDKKEFTELLEAGNGKVVDMTIAPELPGAYEIIDYAREKNVNIMLGHSDALVADAKKAINHGAIGLTHLYNAMSPHTHRNAGLVTAGLLLDELICELICDGFHVEKDVVKVTYEAIGANRIALVTDASLIKGLPDGEYVFSGNQVVKNGIKATVASTGRIAGSVVGMADCVKNMVDFTNCSINEIVMMSAINPSKIAKIENEKGKLAVGYDADLVLLDDSLCVVKTFVRGVGVYEKIC